MTKIAIEIKDCRECPHHMNTHYPTSDSWEKAQYWWCKAKERSVTGDGTGNEEERLSVKKSFKLETLSYVAGYVEWNDFIPVPDWCPIKIED